MTLRHFKELVHFCRGRTECKQRQGQKEIRYLRRVTEGGGVISLSKIDDVIADFQAVSPPHRIGRSVRTALILGRSRLLINGYVKLAPAGITQPFQKRCGLLSAYLVHNKMRYVHRMRHSQK